MRILSVLVLLVLSFQLQAQQVTAFQNQREHFYVFDNDKFIKITELPVVDFKVGGNFVAFLDASMGFKAYYNGEVHELEMGGVLKHQYFPTQSFLVYMITDNLYLIDKNGVKSLLSRFVDDVRADENLVAYHDWNVNALVVYYKGTVTLVEESLAGRAIENFDIGENTVAFITTVEQKFRVFWEGEVYDVMNFATADMKYKADRDIAAFVDPSNNTFNAFYRGEMYELEPFPPQSFQLGDGMVFYVDNTGAFKVFERGETEEINSFPPDSYTVRDSIMVYSETNDFFNAWIDGEHYELERYVPRAFLIDRSTLLYLDDNLNGKIFEDGEGKTVIYDIIAGDFALNRNVISYKVGANTFKVYHNGKSYTQGKP